MTFENKKYPQVDSINELIKSNPYVRTEYKKYIKYMRKLAEKILNECIGTDIDRVCEHLLRYGCGKEQPISFDNFDVKSFWEDGDDINTRLYSDEYINRSSKIEELHFSESIKELNQVIDDYRNFLRGNSIGYINSLEDERGIQTNFMLMEYDEMFKELDAISKNNSVSFDDMNMCEIIRGRYNIAREFIARFSLHFDSALYEILEQYLDCIAESFENKEDDIIKEILKTDNEKCMVRLDDIRREINAFKIVYKDLIDTFVDDMLKDVNVTCTLFHFAKWFVDSSM